jgi:hypothetical protein
MTPAELATVDRVVDAIPEMIAVLREIDSGYWLWGDAETVDPDDDGVNDVLRMELQKRLDAVLAKIQGED